MLNCNPIHAVSVIATAMLSTIHMGLLLTTGTAGSSISDADRRNVAYLMMATLAALLTLVIFIVGVFVVKRLGMRLKNFRVGGEPTPYVDTWSQYRLSEEEIAAATADDEPLSGSDDDEPRRQPPDNTDLPPN
jgi:hypothetical protein